MKGADASADNEIPVPPPVESDLNYGELYSPNFSKTSAYIRFSQTVEECIGCQYDMTEEDDAFLTSYNQKRATSAQLSEDDFEMIMEVFEETAYIRTPFASVDQTVVPYDDMVQGLQQLEAAKVMPHAKNIYEYWKSRRQALANRPLHPTLKFETHQDSDDLDPYVCFRRREVRQTRKTRARDVQSADKLKRLRRELEDGRQLISCSYTRETVKREMLDTDRAIFEQRAQLKEMKVRLGIKTDDEDLVNQKVIPPDPVAATGRVSDQMRLQKRKPVDVPAVRAPSAKEPRLTAAAAAGRPAEVELPQLADRISEKENELRADIENKVLNHQHWNKNHVDLTRDPLSPVKGQTPDLSFRPARTKYLMTPPTSASSENLEEPTAMELDKPDQTPPAFNPGAVVPQDDELSVGVPTFRRRIGRLNRLWIDRRGLASPPGEPVDSYSDRWKYDQQSDDDEDEQPVYEVDPFDMRALKFRASVPLTGLAAPRAKPVPPELAVSSARHALQQQPQAQAQAQPKS